MKQIFLLRKCICFMFFLFITDLYGQYQNLDSILNLSFSKNIKEEKIDLFLKNKNDSLHIYFSKIGYWYYENKDVDKAILYIKRAIIDVNKKNEFNNTFLQEYYYHLGKYLNRINKSSQAIICLNKVLVFNIKNEFTTNAYYELGISNKKLGDFVKATHYFKSTLLLLKNDKKNSKYLSSCINLASICTAVGGKENIKAGLNYIKLVDSLSKTLNISLIRKYNIKSNLATLHNQYEFLDIKSSYKYYSQALQIAKYLKDTTRITKTLSWIGNLFNTTNFNKSIKYTDLALKICPKEDSLALRRIYFYYGLTYGHFGKYKNSIEEIHKGFEYLINDNIKDYNNIDKKLIINSKNKKVILEMLPVLSEAYLKLYEKNKSEINLEKSISYFKLADYVIDLLKMNSDDYKSKLFWRKVSTDIYGKAIRACYLNNKIEDAFYFMEKNKALLLMQDMATQNYRRTLDVPNNLLERETNYKTQLITINESENIQNSDSLLKVRIDIERNLFSLQDSIYKDKEIKLKDPEILTIKEVQRNLKENEVFVEYHVSIDDGYGIYTNNENGYIVFITKNNRYFFEINKLSEVKQHVTNLIKLTKAPFRTEQDKIKFRSLSYKVFDRLFPTQEIKELIQGKKVIIAPDSYLSFLPFESLVSGENTLNYLIKDCTISYLYSYSFLKNSGNKEQKSANYLGFAPVHFNTPDLRRLEHSENEIQNLKNYFKGKAYLKKDATKKNFLEELPNYNIVHLATHADAQDSIDPWITFYDEKLTQSELYLTKNNASMVVLSACKTNLGKQEIGEGVMSLARGFFYGGSQSVVSSLWSVDDKATPYIMDRFYKNLAQNQTKSEALRNAKLHYLENHSLSELSPHYWASFILLGKDDVVAQTNSLWAGVLVICLILLLIFFGYKYRDSSSK